MELIFYLHSELKNVSGKDFSCELNSAITDATYQ